MYSFYFSDLNGAQLKRNVQLENASPQKTPLSAPYDWCSHNSTRIITFSSPPESRSVDFTSGDIVYIKIQDQIIDQQFILIGLHLRWNGLTHDWGKYLVYDLSQSSRDLHFELNESLENVAK